MDGNCSIDDDGVEIQNKGIEENQKKQRDIGKNTHDARITTRRRLNTWGGDEMRNVETPINWKKGEKPMKEIIPTVQRTIKKVTRPGTKTYQKVLPKTKSMIQVRANYINKINEMGDKNDERDDESSPLKKKMKNDIVISKKKENYNKNNNGDVAGLSIPEKQHKKPDENTTRKKCIDCNKSYYTKQTLKNKKKCLICKCGEHGCIKENNCRTSKGDFWICRECKESVESKNILNIPEEPREEIELKGMKRKRKDSESNDHKEIEKETEANPNEKNDMNKITNGNKKVESTNDNVYLSKYNTTIKESDIKYIKGRNWINDSLLTLWMKHLQQVVHNKNENILFVLPTIAQILKIGDAKDLNETLCSLGAFWMEHIIIPVNDNSGKKEGGNHWSLLIYNKHDDKWYHFDSQQGSNIKHARRLVGNVNPYVSINTQPALVETCCTQQNNSYDCGAFVMVHAKVAARMAIEGEKLDKCYVDKREATKVREILYNLISLEIQFEKSRGYTEKEKDEDQDKKNSNKKDRKREEVKEFIAAICGEEKISENTKRDILKYFDGKNNNEKTNMEENNQIQPKIERVCINWAKDTCKKGESCIYKHPVRCEEIMKKGYCEYRHCKYYHPLVCKDNLNQNICRRGHRCTYRHINRETIGYNPNSRIRQQHKENQKYSYNRVIDIRRNEEEWKPQDRRESNDFLWKNMYPWEKDQIIEIWNQKRTERRHRGKWH